MANTTGKKWGGRKAGTPNRGTNSDLKKAIEKVSYKAIEAILADFDKLTINDKIKVLATSLRYVMPQLKSVETTLDTGDNIPKWVNDILTDQYTSEDD